MTELWISIFGYEYLEFTTIVDIHNSVMETIMDIIVQLWISVLAITPFHQPNTHDFADGRKNMNGIFNNYVCSASHMCSGRQFQNV